MAAPCWTGNEANSTTTMKTLKGLARNKARYMWISLRYNDTSFRISFFLVAIYTCNTSGDVLDLPRTKSSNEEETLVKATFRCVIRSVVLHGQS